MCTTLLLKGSTANRGSEFPVSRGPGLRFYIGTIDNETENADGPPIFTRIITIFLIAHQTNFKVYIGVSSF